MTDLGEIARLRRELEDARRENHALRTAIETMRIAGCKFEFQIAFDAAKALACINTPLPR